MANSAVMSAPKRVEIAITGKCNLTCSYCYYADEMVARGDLSTEKWLNFFDELGRMGVIEMTPFRRRSVYPPRHLAVDRQPDRQPRTQHEHQWNVHQRRNNRTVADGQAPLSSRFGSDFDGWLSADIHNASRPKSFDRTLRGIRLLHRGRFSADGACRHNYKDLRNIARLLFEDVGVSNLQHQRSVSMRCDFACRR